MNTPQIEAFDPLPPLPEPIESAAEKVIRKTPWWAISVGLHAMGILIAGFFWIVQATEPETVPIIGAPKQAPKPPEFPEMPVESPVPLNVEPKETPLVTVERDPVKELETPDNKDFRNVNGESLLNPSLQDFKSKSTNDVIGPSGGAAGRFGQRGEGGKIKALGQGGGGKKTEDAVLAALLWLARHQNPDGSWSVRAHVGRCTATCSPNPGHDDFDAGVTGLSMLAFLGAGYTHVSRDVKEGISFGDVVRKGLQWMMTHQDPEGCIGSRTAQKYMYNHSICALAISEAYGLTGSNLFRDQAQKAIDFVVAAQNPGKGWRYGFKCGDSDSSVTGWAVMALKSAELSGLLFPRTAYDGTRAWFDETTEESYGRVGYTHKGTGKVYVPGMNESFEHNEALTAIGVMSRIFMDRNKGDARLANGCDLLLAKKPAWTADQVDFYYWYYASLALFQFDGPVGPKWKAWNEDMKTALVKNQNTASTGCRRGSWEPVDRWSGEGGRVYATAINALTLEVYYRYAAVFGKRE